MDAATVRQHLRELNDRLADLEQEREVLRNLVNGYEGWLRLKGGASVNPPSEPQKVDAPKRARPSSRQKGAISFNSAVLQVVKEANGQPVDGREIVARAIGLGAKTEAQRPERVADLMLYSHRKRGQRNLERVAPLTWRWTGE